MKLRLGFWLLSLVVWVTGLVYIVSIVASAPADAPFNEPFAVVYDPGDAVYVSAIMTLDYWREVGLLTVFLGGWTAFAMGAFYSINWVGGGLFRDPEDED